MIAPTPCPACCTGIGERFGPADCSACGGTGTAPTSGLRVVPTSFADCHVELLRQVADLTAERDALRRQVDAVKALHRRDGQGRKGRERCYHCHFAYPCPTVRAADPQRPSQAPENAQEPQTPAPGSPSTPETLSGPLSAPDRGTA